MRQVFYLKTLFLYTGLFICLLISWFWIQPKNIPSQEPYPLVKVTPALRQVIAPSIHLSGTILSPTTINLRPRVEGELLNVYFKEGESVQKGQLLAAIDDVFLQAQLKQAQAILKKDQADLQYAEAELKRNKILFGKNFISSSKYEEIVANYDKCCESVQIDQAIIDQYQIQIGYTKIYSPFEGRIGFQQIDIGSIIRLTDTTPLTTLVQVDPIEVEFALPEKYLTQINQKDLINKTISLKFLNNKSYPLTGVVKLINNQIENTTGSLLIRAQIPNPDHTLIPGQYVEVKISLEEPSHKILIPMEALQLGQNNSYVYVYDSKTEKTIYRPIVAQNLDNQRVWVEKGLKEGEAVVTEGHLKIKDQSKVRIIQDLQKSENQKNSFPNEEKIS